MSRPGCGWRARTSGACLVVMSALLLLRPAPLPGQGGPPGGTQAGRQVFETICVACHTIGAGVRIGPDLQGVTDRRDPDWLRRFIRDPAEVRASGDSIAAANQQQYGITMPNLGLSEAQVEAVIAHLGGAQPAPAGRPRLYLPTLALALAAAAGLTVIALATATKRAETRA